MAKLEEIKKKFEDRQMDEEQMELVTGGTAYESFADAKLLAYMNIAQLGKYSCDSFKKAGRAIDELKAAWEKIGIKVVCNKPVNRVDHYYDGYCNKYFLVDGLKKISRKEAWAMAKEFARTHDLA